SITTTSGAHRSCWRRSSASRNKAMPERGSPTRASVTRRRALRIVAAVAGVPFLIAGVRATAPKGAFHTWRGSVLDAVSELTLWHTDATFAERTIVKVRREIARFERIFSLYRPESEISRLNEAGRLAKPSSDFTALVEESRRLGELSGG